MPETMVRHTRRRPQRRPGIKGIAAVVLTAVLLISTAVYYVAFYPKQVEKTVYPLLYVDEINRYASEYFLDPARVAAVIYCESSFRPDAVSSVGAIGLMQLMPSTGEWIASKLKEDFQTENLYDPATNIRYGCWYLDYLNGRFDADPVKVTAAYHAGGGKVDEWLKDPSCSSDGKTLTAIPSAVTSSYVENVGRMTDKYKEIMHS